MQAALAPDTQPKATRARSLLIGIFLFSGTVAFCLWQNTRVAALFDLSYLLDTSWRISLGQLPYRDFPFAHAPGTFLLHAALIHIFGRVYWPHIACAALESGAATLITWRILQRILQPFETLASWIAALLAATLIPLGIYSIFPHPFYDGDGILVVLVALYLLCSAAETWEQSSDRLSANAKWWNVLAGASCVVPLFFKQNIGLALIAAVTVSTLAVALLQTFQHRRSAAPVWFLCGALTAIALSALLIHLTVGLANYRYWTVTFATQRRLPAAGEMLSTYRQLSLLWTLPATIAGFALLRWKRHEEKRRLPPVAFVLLACPFLWQLIFLAISSNADDRADTFLSLWPHLLILATIFAIIQIARFLRQRSTAASTLSPILLLVTIHGAFLSQQLWGSTYAIWPLLILLIAPLLIEVRDIAAPLAGTIAGTLLICGTLYAISLERMSYIHLDGAPAHATLTSLRGMSTSGPWLPEFEAMLRFTNSEIPPNDGILLIPGEDPFYFATGRTPQFPVLLTDRATDPYTPQQTSAEVRARNIRWLILKRDLQLNASPDYETPELLKAVEQEFVLDRSLPGYDIYRRK